MKRPMELFDPDRLPMRRDCRTYMASSYDREGGNFDMGNFDMVLAGEAVLLDTAGSGFITRLWSANPAGQLKIYFDGAAEPSVDEPFARFLQRMPFSFGRGQVERSAPEFPAIVRAREPLGCTSYALLPFRKGCRITLNAEAGCYYQVNYTLLDSPHSLPTFCPASWPQWTEENRAVENYLKSWSSGGAPSQTGTGRLRRNGLLSLEPGRRSVIFDVTGSHLIRSLRFKVKYPAGIPAPRTVTEPPWIDDGPVPADSAVTRHAKEHLEIHAYWDDAIGQPIEEKGRQYSYVNLPAIRSPLAYFFMDYGAFERYESLFASKRDSEYSGRWPMPFRNRAIIELRNNACVAVNEIEYEIEYEPVSSWPERALHFHARFHAERPTFGYDLTDYRRDVVYLRNRTGELNYPILRTWGRGHFVGCCFNADFSETPLAQSMVESDEAVFVDDDSRRTMWGTGTEDYLNDAWGIHPVTGLLSGGRWTDGHFFGYRFHLSDAIPFEKKLAFTLEHGSSNNCSAAYQSVAYYYLEPLSSGPSGRGEEPPSAVRSGRRYFSL